jgi:hypothetical protein
LARARTGPFIVGVQPFTIVVKPFTVVVNPFTVVVKPFTVVVEPCTIVVKPFTLVVKPFTLVVQPFTVAAQGPKLTWMPPVLAQKRSPPRASGRRPKRSCVDGRAQQPRSKAWTKAS